MRQNASKDVSALNKFTEADNPTYTGRCDLRCSDLREEYDGHFECRRIYIFFA